MITVAGKNASVRFSTDDVWEVIHSLENEENPKLDFLAWKFREVIGANYTEPKTVDGYYVEDEWDI